MDQPKKPKKERRKAARVKQSAMFSARTAEDHRYKVRVKRVLGGMARTAVTLRIHPAICDVLFRASRRGLSTTTKFLEAAILTEAQRRFGVIPETNLSLGINGKTVAAVRKEYAEMVQKGLGKAPELVEPSAS